MGVVRAYVDTNLLLQFRPLTQLDWCSILDVSSVELVLVPAVVRELEQKKHGDNKRLRKRATATLDMITKHLKDGLTGRLRENVTLRFETAEPSIDFRAHGLSAEIVDDWLLASLIEDAVAERVLVTDDTTLFLKTRAKGIPVVRPPADARLPPEEDEEFKKLNEENRALKQQLSKRPDLVLTFADRTTVLREEVSLRPRLSEAELDKSIQAKRQELMDQVHLQTQMHPHQVAFRKFQFDDKELDGYLKKLRIFLREQDARNDIQQRSAVVELRLHNRGLAPASGIEIHLLFPEGVTLGESLHLPVLDEPLPPDFFRAPFSDGSNSARISRLIQVSLPNERKGWRRSAGGRVLKFSIDELLHTLTMTLDRFWIAFPVASGQLKGFDVNCSILVSHPPDEFSATLSFVPTAAME